MVPHATWRAQSPYHVDDMRRNVQAASRFRQGLVVRQDDHLPLLRHRGEHTSQAVNLAGRHSLRLPDMVR